MRTDDIEAGLSSDWWRTLFDETYLLTDADAVEDPGITAWEVDALLEATGMLPHHRVVDLCCGQGRHCIELATRGYRHVTGVDGSAYLIDVAKSRSSKFETRFETGDVRHVTPAALGLADFVTLLGNSFGYMEHGSDDEDVLRAAYNLLVPGGTVYLDVADGDWLRESYVSYSWEWVAADKMAVRERKLSGDRLVSREMVVDAKKGVVADRTYAERLYSRDHLCDLLRSVGFVDVHVVGDLRTSGSDPGMMAHRFTVVGRRVVKVTVALGDPKLPDRVKPSGGFDAADLDTVARMKTALASVEGCVFQYVDDHASFVQAVAGNADVVLNLCDEGFFNDPRSEAVVPAMLESLGVPYTGCPPACLSLCYDKAVVRALAARHGIPVPAEVPVAPRQPVPAWDRFPAFVKPGLGDSSVGIDASSLVHDRDGLVVAVEARRQHGAVLVQEFLPGAEFSVGLVGNGDGLAALPVLEVDYSGLGGEVPILGYESKWVAGSPWWDRVRYKEAADSGAVRAAVAWSRDLFRILGCCDYARVDWRCGADGRPRLLEVNPNPGWCWDGKMALMADMAGQDYAWFLRSIIVTALARSAPTRRP